MLAARGARNFDQGEEKIEDEAAASTLREKGKKIRSRAALIALLLTVVAAYAIFSVE
jgi:hypothetical protein